MDNWDDSECGSFYIEKDRDDWDGFEDKNYCCLNDIEPYMKYNIQS